MRVIIAAGGEAERWKNYRNTSKHLIEIEGEVLLHRTIKQFKKYTNDIIVVAKDESYSFDGIKLEKPLVGDWYDFGKMYSSNHLWSEDRTIIVFGDVYFTDIAVNKIVSNNKEYMFFIRKYPSKFTGKKYGEIFALSFSGGTSDKIKKLLEDLIERKQEGVGAWQLYFYMHNINNIRDIRKHTVGKSFIEINDWTEDFDKPEDLINWERMRLKLGAKIEHKPHKSPLHGGIG